MKRIVMFGLLAVGLFAGAPWAWADLAPFPKPNPTKAKFTIEVNNTLVRAQLYIPKKFVTGGGKFGVGLEDQQGAFAPTVPTIIAGMCLSLAAVCVGVWFVRRKQGKLSPIPLAIVIGLVTAIAVAGTLTWANGPPPPNFNPNQPNPNFGGLASLITVTDDINVVLTPAGDSIKLVINQAMYNRLKNTNVIGVGNPTFPPPGVNPIPVPGVGNPPPGVNPIPGPGTQPPAPPKPGVGSTTPPAKQE